MIKVTPQPVIVCQSCKQDFVGLRRSYVLDERTVSNNYIPLEGEAKDISEVLADADHDLAAYDACISKMETALQRMKADRKQLLLFRSKQSYVLSSLRLIPADIWSEIFLDRCFMEAPGQATAQAAAKISLVCKAWRDVIAETPRVWSRLQLSAQSIPTSSDAFMKTMIDVHLTRSADVPLDVDVSFEISYANSYFPYVLAMSYRRIRYLFLRNFSGVQIAALQACLAATPLPRLEQLRLAPEPHGESFGKHLSISSDCMPALTEVFLSGRRHIPVMLMPSLRERLTTLNLENLSSRVVADIVRACPSMTHLSIVEGRPSTSHVIPTLISSAVTHFTLACGLESSFKLIPYFSLPSLTSLTLADGTPTGYNKASKVVFPAEDVAALIERSSCSLSSLTIEGMRVQPDIAVVLAMTPQLATFCSDLGTKYLLASSPSRKRHQVAAVNSAPLEHIFGVPCPLLTQLKLSLFSSETQMNFLLDMIDESGSLSSVSLTVFEPSWANTRANYLLGALSVRVNGLREMGRTIDCVFYSLDTMEARVV